MNNYEVGDKVILKSGVIATITDDAIYDGVQIYRYSIPSDEPEMFILGLTRKEEIDTYYFEQGEAIAVRDEEDDPWITRVYISTLPENAMYRYVVVNVHYEEEYENNKIFDTVAYKQAIPKKKENK